VNIGQLIAQLSAVLLLVPAGVKEFLSKLLVELQAIEAEYPEGPVKLRVMILGDAFKDGSVDIQGTFPGIILDEPVEIVAALIMLRALNRIDSDPTDNRVEFSKDGKVRIWSFFQASYRMTMKMFLMPLDNEDLATLAAKEG